MHRGDYLVRTAVKLGHYPIRTSFHLNRAGFEALVE
jgi:hypothetical protein